MTSKASPRLNRLWIRYRSPVQVGLSLVGAVALLWILVNPQGRGTDAYSYWSFDPSHPYAQAMGNVGAPIAFRYAPPIALLLTPLHALPWPAFLWLYTALLLGALAWMCRSWTLAAIAIYPILLELSVANIHLLIAAALVLGLRRPAAWSFLLLTKITPGVCLIWFAVRGEWRSLATALGITGLLAVVSWMHAPDLWSQRFAMLASDIGAPSTKSEPLPLIVRLPIAAGVIAWGARRGRTWTLAVGALLAIPTIWPQSFAVLISLPVLDRARLELSGATWPLPWWSRMRSSS